MLIVVLFLLNVPTSESTYSTAVPFNGYADKSALPKNPPEGKAIRRDNQRS